MSERSVDDVVFDIGGVLLDWNPDYLYRELIPDAGQREHFLTAVATPEWNLQMDAGRPWAEAVAELTSLHPQHAEWIEAYDTGWLKMVSGLIDGTADVLTDLRAQGIPTYALTNFSAEKWEIAKEAFPILAGFSGEVVSGTEQTVKPDEKIYRILIERYGLDPARSFYTDDKDYNVVAARAVGLDAETFVDAPTLRRQLAERGLRV
jgi:HAD superfamily hydrolase (TIGR01509 family)